MGVGGVGVMKNSGNEKSRGTVPIKLGKVWTCSVGYLLHQQSKVCVGESFFFPYMFLAFS
jgi:hypothetical protein